MGVSVIGKRSSNNNTAETGREDGEKNVQSRCGFPFAIIFVSVLLATTAYLWYPFLNDYFKGIVHNLPGIFANATVVALTMVGILGLVVVFSIHSSIGTFVGSFREWGISRLYIPLWKSRKKSETPDVPSKLESKIFYIFRRGSVIQLASDIARNEKDKFRWIKDSLGRNNGIQGNSLRNDMWNLAEKIRTYHPKSPKFVFFAYFRNVSLQMSDTFCLLISLMCFFIFGVNTVKSVVDYFLLEKQPELVFIFIPLILVFVFFFLMVIFKNGSIGAAHTFLNAIEGGFVEIDKDEKLRNFRPDEVTTRDSRFKIGVSFCGEHRDTVLSVVTELLKREYTKNDIFYDEWHEHLINGPNKDIDLQKIYREKCDFIIVFLSKEYNNKNWTGGIEWKAIRSFINEKKDVVCLLNVDGLDINTVDGLSSTTDIAKKINDLNTSEVADIIRKWHMSKTTPSQKQ